MASGFLGSSFKFLLPFVAVLVLNCYNDLVRRDADFDGIQIVRPHLSFKLFDQPRKRLRGARSVNDLPQCTV